MTDFGRRTGDMNKATYDADESGVVDDSEKLDGSTKAQVQDHTPKTHSHTDPPQGHHASHEVGGSDEIDLSGLSGGLQFVDRGDIAAHDYVKTDFTIDSNWNDKDLSSIVPPGTALVQFLVVAQNADQGPTTMWRPNGYSNAINIMRTTSPSSNTILYARFWMPVDANRVIEYNIYNTSWTLVNMSVIGWLI